MRAGTKQEILSGEYVEVINLFQSFHINYIVHSYNIIRQLSKEYNITKHEVFVLSCIYDLVNCSPNRTRKNSRSAPLLPSHSLILSYVESIIHKNRLTVYLRQLTEGHFIKVLTKGGRRGKVIHTRTYDLDYNGYLVTRRYATLMSELYRDNYFSKQADKKIKKAKILRAKNNPQEPTE